MFATVECREVKIGMRNFLRDAFLPPEIEIIPVKLSSGGVFYRVIVSEYRGSIPVRQVCDRLVRLRKGVIFEINFPWDESLGELEFIPEELEKVMLFNSAAEYLSKIGLPPLKSSVTVFDPDGTCAERIFLLVPLFSKIEVYTNRKAYYSGISDGLMEKHGVSLLISDRFAGKPPESTAVICPGEVPFCGFFRGILFTNAENVPPCSCCVRGDGIDLPKEYALLRPEGISKMHFASALYEKCGVSELSELSFRKLRLT